MSHVIQFLEALARDTRPLGATGYSEAVAAFDGPARDALLARDPAAIATALGLPSTYACAIATPDHDEPARDDQPADGEEETPASPEAYAA
jgi:hypothetical protein